MGLLDAVRISKLKNGLAKTREGMLGKLARIITAKSTIDDDLLEQMEEILIAADVGVEATTNIMESIKKRVKEERYENPAELQRLLHDEIQRQFPDGSSASTPNPFQRADVKPFIILVVGVNGVGKTTTIGKLAYEYRRAGNKVVIAAADTFRAAAGEQLEIWAERAGAEIIQQGRGSDPAAVAYDAVHAASARGADVVIIDTAGRIHTKVNLMEELKKIKRVIQKHDPSAPHEVFLVIDATTGQNGLRQARQFGDAVGITGLIITKLDGTAKGGVALAISREMRMPVKFIGVGEQIDDLQPFDKAAFVQALFEH
jgi:fused signal recognition particle receptor